MARHAGRNRRPRRDVWEPLLAIADAAGGDWPALARVAAVSLVSAARGDRPSLGIRLLSDLRTVFGNAEAMATATILEALHAMSEAPWSDIRGKPLNDRGLAVRLRQYSVKSKTLRIGSGTSKGYARADLWDAWESYLPSCRRQKRNKRNKRHKGRFTGAGCDGCVG